MCYNGGMLEVDGVLATAYELKVPLVALRQLALSLDGAGEHDERVRSEMVSVSERAMRQVNDLITMRRLKDGLFEMESVAVREVCDAVSLELEKLFGYNQKHLRIKYLNRSKLVVANRDLLYRVIYNFLLNAMHYSDEETLLTVKDCRGKVQVAIRDYGPMLPVGLWRELKNGWLEKPTEIAMRTGSSGLGLFVASKFSQYMGAKVGAVRHRDGTSFFVNLSISKQARLFE